MVHVFYAFVLNPKYPGASSMQTLYKNILLKDLFQMMERKLLAQVYLRQKSQSKGTKRRDPHIVPSSDCI